MKIAILGYGEQGRSAYDYWKNGNEITICDSNPMLTDLPPGVEQRLGPEYANNLDRYDLIIRSPSVHPRDLVHANPPNILERVTTVTEEFMRVCPAPIIGVTGTKGKGTTSSLIARILEQAGHRVHLGGNIGIPPLDLLRHNIEPNDWVVLELANFQLIDLRLSPDIAVCLMVVPEHMDWHSDVPEYIGAKQQLFRNQTTANLAVFNRINQLSVDIASVSMARKISFEVPEEGALPNSNTGATITGDTICMDRQPICNIIEVTLPGRHNLQNVCAAIAATWDIVGGNTETIKQAIASFKGLEHRLEFVRQVAGVQYIDDSFGTTPETAIVALQAYTQPKVIILGGSDKGANYGELAETIARHNVRKVILIGQTASKIQAALDKIGYQNYLLGGNSMLDIVTLSQAQTQPGDIVLLSTASASFDMFNNYQDRGSQFKAAVQSLPDQTFVVNA